MDVQVNRLLVGPGEEAIIASARAARGIDFGRFDPKLLYQDPLECGTQEYRGLPLHEPRVLDEQKQPVERNCYFYPGNEDKTTAEHARYQGGRVIIHDQPQFPTPSGWEMRVIDNKFPITDERNIWTGDVYDESYAMQIGDFTERHAIGKDYMLIPTPFHNIRSGLLDYRTMLMLEQIFTAKEIEKDHVQYVAIFRNNSGFPVKTEMPGDVVRACAICCARERGIELSEEGLESLPKIEYYRFQGERSGASQVHPHDRIVSLGVLPEKMHFSYDRLERDIKDGRRRHPLYQELMDSRELTLREGTEFALMVDKMPSHLGGLVVAGRNAKNILELGEGQRDELAYLMQLGQTLADVCYGGHPSNAYFRQIFDKNGHQKNHPNYRMYVRIEPRVSIHAGFELAVGIPVIPAEPAQIKAKMAEAIQEHNL